MLASTIRFGGAKWETRFNVQTVEDTKSVTSTKAIEDVRPLCYYLEYPLFLWAVLHSAWDIILRV
jgi:hypothetical protein